MTYCLVFSILALGIGTRPRCSSGTLELATAGITRLVCPNVACGDAACSCGPVNGDGEHTVA